MSTLKDRIQADLKSAMLARDTLKTQTLQGLKAAILNEEVAQKILIARESKKRDEAAELFEKGGNQASADKERAEKAILSVYLPEPLSEAEIQKVVDEVVAEIKPVGPKDMGRVIGAVKSRVGNTADGAVVAKLVKNSLQ